MLDKVYFLRLLMNFQIAILVAMCLLSFSTFAQNSYSLRLNLDSLDLDNEIACYHLEVSNLGPEEWALGGTDIAIVYDASTAIFIEGSESIVDDATMDYVITSISDSVGTEPFSTITYNETLGFLRFGVFANSNILNPKVFPPDSSWNPIVQFCVKLKIDDITDPNTCFQVNFSNQELVNASLLPPDNMLELRLDSFGVEVLREEPINLVPNATFDACFILDEDSQDLCSDGIDNDEDGLLDCLDPGCGMFCPEDNSTTCNDGIDNDSDGLIDCNDDSCIDLSEISFDQREPSNCPQLDNGELTYSFASTTLEFSVDGGMTFQDSPVFSNLTPGNYHLVYRDTITLCERETTMVLLSAQFECTEESPTECSDGIDNDGDGLVDCMEDVCASLDVCAQLETSTSACSDGIDNDGDGLADCQDPDCRFFNFCQIDTEDLVYMPSVFSLTSNNLNNILAPSIKDNQPATVVKYGIYDRAGNRVFWQENLNSNDPQLIWRGDFNGSKVASGVYVYSITVDINGVLATFTGDITALK